MFSGIGHGKAVSYGGVALDGLNVALVIHAPGPMAEGNWAVGAYIDQRADENGNQHEDPTPTKSNI